MLRLRIPRTWVAATDPTRHPTILPNLSKEPDGVILIWEFECDLVSRRHTNQNLFHEPWWNRAQTCSDHTRFPLRVVDYAVFPSRVNVSI
jgi:hypothetical protein